MFLSLGPICVGNATPQAALHANWRHTGCPGPCNTIDVSAALERQRTEGGKLGDNLVTMASFHQLISQLYSTRHNSAGIHWKPRVALSDLSTSDQDEYATGVETPSMIAI